MDNWFTSVPMMEEMVGEPYKLTISAIWEFLESKPKDCKTLMFSFDQKKTLVSYMPTRTKIVVLLSTLNEDLNMSENGKPDIVLNSSSTLTSHTKFSMLIIILNLWMENTPFVFTAQVFKDFYL
ncbi:hypothetical protein QE152_g40035 [Popillia japonica]|uniref:PiggyBac transposable element-derived protein domain-containing protein n=1 Tax=Popillia japonica TaxID=7064 RepID=A0AAW1HSJ7_POPJA